MTFSKDKISAVLLFCIYFLTFMGFYAIVMVSMNFVGELGTRFVSIPIRILIVTSLILYFFINFDNLKRNTPRVLFIVFSLFYISRLLYEFNSLELYYISQQEVTFYFLSFSFIPFLSLSSVALSSSKLDSIFKAFLCCGLFFSVVSLTNYGHYIGHLSRIGISSEENTVSPLILSYNAVMTLAVFLFYMIYNKTSLSKKVLLILGIVFSTIPFLLGASRGSLVAIFAVLFLNFFYSSTLSSKLKYIVLFVLFFLTILSLDQYFGGALFERFFQLEQDIEKGESSAIRISIWKSSWNQFANNPIFGDKLAVDGWKNYPHNIIFEVLQTTGVLGFIPFSILLITALKYAIYILKNNKSYSWISVIFILSFIQNMFSGNLYTAAWFWTSMALVISSYSFIKEQTGH